MNDHIRSLSARPRVTVGCNGNRTADLLVMLRQGLLIGILIATTACSPAPSDRGGTDHQRSRLTLPRVLLHSSVVTYLLSSKSYVGTSIAEAASKQLL